MNWLKKHYILVTVVVFLVALNAFFYFYGPREIVEWIGVHNTYLLTFSIAVIGGLSTITGTVLYTSMATFAAGGATPWLLGLSGGFGIFISDSIFFFLAQLGLRHVPEKWKSQIDKIRNSVEKYPTWQVLVFVLLCLSFLPLPNDILMVALAMTNVSYKTLAPVILAGSINVAMLSSYFGSIWF